MSTTYCRICEAACGLTYEPGGPLRPDRAHPVSHGFVCAKGTRFAEVASHPSRVTHPAIRRDGALTRTSWDAAIDAAASRIRRVIEQHGPHAVGLYIGNPLAFHAAGQISAIFLGRALGTRNVFTASSQDCNTKFAAAALMHGTPVLHPIPDFENAEMAVLFGTNPAVSQASFVHLEGGATIFDRMQKRGADIVWVDVRETESAKRWGELVTVRPGTDVWLILALLGLMKAPAPDDRVEGFETLHALAKEVSPERAESITRVPADRIRELAAQIRGRRTALHLSVGVNHGPFGTLSYVALQALAYASGNYDRKGGSVFSRLGVGGARVARQAGLFTSRATSRIGGFPTVFDGLPGGVMADEILTEGAEQIRAMIVVAGDPIRSIPGSARLSEAFASLDTVVAVDLFESLTGQHADVFLPATSWLERADVALPGLPLQTVDLVQTTSAVMPRVGQSRPEHEIFAALSLALGRPLFDSALACRWLATAGSLDRAIPWVTDLLWKVFDGDPSRRGHGVRVPTPRPGTYLGKGPMTPGHRVRFWTPELEPERARLAAWRLPDDGLVLLGRRRRIGHNSWLHGGTRLGKPEQEAWMAPAEMARLGLENGSEVTLTSEAGAMQLPVRGKAGVVEGTVVVPHGELDANVNLILPSGAPHIEPISGQLRMTGIPVSLQRADG
ncbi:MAG: molybdopterin-dependent oxidoreductase [Sandaracinaceae bacterium]